MNDEGSCCSLRDRNGIYPAELYLRASAALANMYGRQLLPSKHRRHRKLRVRVINQIESAGP